MDEDVDSNETDLETKLTRIFILERFKSTEDGRDIEKKSISNYTKLFLCNILLYIIIYLLIII